LPDLRTGRNNSGHKNKEEIMKEKLLAKMKAEKLAEVQ